MEKKDMTVADDVVVTMEYLLRLDDGEEIDSSSDDDPFEFLQGHGQIIPGLEKELYGMRIGEAKEVTVAPSEGYGELDPEDVDTVSRDIFPADMDLFVGQSLRLRDADSGQIMQASITKLAEDAVVLDFNHPLAGETLIFDVKITDLRPATSEELAHGHAHGTGHHH